LNSFQRSNPFDRAGRGSLKHGHITHNEGVMSEKLKRFGRFGPQLTISPSACTSLSRCRLSTTLHATAASYVAFELAVYRDPNTRSQLGPGSGVNRGIVQRLFCYAHPSLFQLHGRTFDVRRRFFISFPARRAPAVCNTTQSPVNQPPVQFDSKSQSSAA